MLRKIRWTALIALLALAACGGSVEQPGNGGGGSGGGSTSTSTDDGPCGPYPTLPDCPCPYPGKASVQCVGGTWQCPACTADCASDQDCNVGEYCAQKGSVCGNGGGTCTPKPSVCDDSQHVGGWCACDGNIYSDPCAAAAAGQALSPSGGCALAAGQFACGERVCDAAAQFCFVDPGDGDQGPTYKCLDAASLPGSTCSTPDCSCAPTQGCFQAMCAGDSSVGVTVTCNGP
jgi:hypothetical protein